MLTRKNVQLPSTCVGFKIIFTSIQLTYSTTRFGIYEVGSSKVRKGNGKWNALKLNLSVWISFNKLFSLNFVFRSIAIPSETDHWSLRRYLETKSHNYRIIIKAKKRNITEWQIDCRLKISWLFSDRLHHYVMILFPYYISYLAILLMYTGMQKAWALPKHTLTYPWLAPWLWWKVV